MTFVDRLDALINAKGVSNYKLAKELGVPDSLIGYWRRGTRQPAMDNLMKLADYFNVTTDYLLGRTDNPQIHTKELTIEGQPAVVHYSGNVSDEDIIQAAMEAARRVAQAEIDRRNSDSE